MCWHCQLAERLYEKLNWLRENGADQRELDALACMAMEQQFRCTGEVSPQA